MKIILLVTLFIFIFSSLSFSQLSEGGLPISFYKKTRSKVPFTTMETIDNEKIIKEEENKRRIGNTPYRFAKTFKVDLNPKNSGKIEKLSDGGLLWRIGIESKKAYSISLILNKFHLPDNALLFVYNYDKSHILGAFTSRNNQLSNILPITPVKGDKIIVEYYEPSTSEFKGEINIGTVGHDYKNIYKLLDNKQSNNDCMVNINCPEGDDWQLLKRAVCRTIINSNEFCTGTLINNTNYDGKAYFITANHCDSLQSDANSTLFYFNYESQTCEGNFGPLDQSIAGSTLIATAPANRIDISLLELSSKPPKEFNPFYAGWSNIDIAPQKGIIIHHPDGELKKISVSDEPSETGSFGDTYDANTHWFIKKWEIGATAEGSSGGPLFDQNHLLVGALTGGPATCDLPYSDYFAKFASAWDKFDKKENQLKYWLDPANLGVKTLEGFDPYNRIPQTDASIMSIISPQKEYCATDYITPEIKIQNRGIDPLLKLSIRYKIDNEDFIIQNWIGNIKSYETASIKLNNINVNEGLHRFISFISGPNDKNDENKTNDTLSIDFTVKKGEQVTLDLLTDKFGYETYWNLINDKHDTLYSGDNYLSYNEIKKDFCLAKACYTFNIYDRFGDGICCRNDGGKFILYNQSKSEIIDNGGEFGAHYSKDFCIQTSAPDFDVEIQKVFSPQNLYCKPTLIIPTVVIKNTGKSTINKVLASFQLDNSNPINLIWSGNLSSYKSDTIRFAEIKLGTGHHQFKYLIELLDNSDNYPDNNTISVNTHIGNCNTILLDLNTDYSGNETTWILTDSDNQLISKGGPYRIDIEQKIQERFNIFSDKCYRFTFYDSQADGICCDYGEGYFNLVNISSKDTLLSGTNFGEKTSINFCTKPLNINDTVIGDFISVYPNPATVKITIENFELKDCELKLYSLLGKLILTENFSGYFHTINVNKLSEGIYLLNVTSDKKRTTKKIIVVKPK